MLITWFLSELITTNNVLVFLYLLISRFARSVKGIGPNLHVPRLNVFLLDSCLITDVLGHSLPFLRVHVGTSKCNGTIVIFCNIWMYLMIIG